MSGSVDSHRPSVLTLYFGHLNFFPETRICSCPILEPIQRASVLLSFNLRPEILPKSSKICIADVRDFSEPSKIRVVPSAYWLILTSYALIVTDGLGQDLRSKNKQIWGKGTALPNSSLRLEEVA